MRLFWWLFRFRRRATQTWRLLGKEDPMTAPASVKRDRSTSDLSDTELLAGVVRARVEAVEYWELDEPGPAGMRTDLMNLLLDEWAERHRGDCE